MVFKILISSFLNRLQQLYNDIKAKNGLDPHIVGGMIASFLEQAFQGQNFTFHNEATLSITSTELIVKAVLPVWGTYVSATLKFTNASALDLDLGFQVNITQVGGKEKNIISILFLSFYICLNSISFYF